MATKKPEPEPPNDQEEVPAKEPRVVLPEEPCHRQLRDDHIIVYYPSGRTTRLFYL